ncbi:hypothetical protein GCM10009760_21220 [Kitasatospora kazusensis]|uniref:B12-binding domain-containing protein n=1 Tax=Kitasatospora kazusensis TaxID=407974 RepID=A0ABN2ZAE9_9ACTN
MLDRSERTVVLAGVGGDSHSVGIITLRNALQRAGYHVRFLSIQNTAAELHAAAAGADAVLVSNMDGHAAYYLRDLPSLRAEEPDGAVWYIGGNPSLAGDEPAAAELAGLGFDRVFLGYVEPAEVISVLDRDLTVRECGFARPAAPAGRALPEVRPMPRRRSPAEQRDDVLAQWPTGHPAGRLEENAEVCAARGNLAAVQEAADRDGRTLIHPRTGVAGVREQIELFRTLEEAGADVLSFQIDSLTRNNAHEQVEMLLKESVADPGAFAGLNGFPLVNHGVEAGRSITAYFPHVPFQVRHSTRDPRLLAEITFASGITSFEGGALTYNLPYYRDYSPRQSVRRWQYVDRLSGIYHERFGITVDREFFGVLTATMVPPCLAVAVDVLETLLAAEEGVKSVSLGYAEQGNRAQDIGAIRALRRVARGYLDARGHQDVAVHTVFHQYMAAFPADPEKSRALLHGSAVSARLSGATRLMLKTVAESSHIPSGVQNAAGVALVRAAWAAEADTAAPGLADFEEELTVTEASAILDAVLGLDASDLGERIALAVERGLLDVPFSPNRWNAGKAMCARDSAGAVRFAVVGDIPLPEQVRRLHRDAVRSRLRRTGGDLDAMVESDVLRTARGDFAVWPLTS